jgi:hypothetical protein
MDVDPATERGDKRLCAADRRRGRDDVGSGGQRRPLSGITAATAGNTIANAANAQVWNWDTLTTGTALKLASTSMTTGSLLSLSDTNISATGDVLNISNAGTGRGLYVTMPSLGGNGVNMDIAHFSANAGGGGSAKITIDNVGSATKEAEVAFASNGAAKWNLGMDLTDSNTAAFGLYDYTNSKVVLFVDTADHVGIGTTTPTAGAALDLGSNTNSILLPVGTTAQEPGSPAAGMMRYNSTISNVEYYNGSAWIPFRPSGGPPGSGYFVITKTTYDGNRGGLAGANASCLTELTTNTGWWGYANANAAGILVAAKVKAFLCDGTTCNTPTYYFANANDSSAGGGSFTTDASGFGPNDSLAWGNGDHFGGMITGNTSRYWTGRLGVSNTAWDGSSSASNCTAWTSTGASGEYGVFTATANARWRSTTQACGLLANLICFVNP